MPEAALILPHWESLSGMCEVVGIPVLGAPGESIGEHGIGGQPKVSGWGTWEQLRLKAPGFGAVP